MAGETAVALDAFKVCPKCEMIWKNRDDLLNDPEIDLVGYQVNFKDLKAGVFMFNHETCETTLSIRAELFLDLYSGPLFRERKTGTDSCPGYCLYEQNMMTCPAKCECAYVRTILHKIKTGKAVLESSTPL